MAKDNEKKAGSEERLDRILTLELARVTEAAAVAADQGVVIHTITYGADADQALMQEVAQMGGGQHWHAPDSTQLTQVFDDIADNLPTMLME